MLFRNINGLYLAQVAWLLAPPACGGDAGRTVGAGAAVRVITPSFESYSDLNNNGRHDPDEPFDDADGDGELDTLWLGGFGPRHPTGVHDPLTVRTLALRIDEALFTLTAVDALGLSTGRIQAIRAGAHHRLQGRPGLSPERMIVASTHTHQAPDTIGIFGPDSFTPGWDPAYLDLVVAEGVESIVEAVEALAPAELVIASAQVGEGVVRDTVAPDILDPRVGILQARTPGGDALATLVSAACHPEAAWMDNTLISADFPHVLRESLELAYGGTAIFFAADLGLMQTPEEIGAAGFERAAAVGRAYAEAVTGALTAAEPADSDRLAPVFRSRDITLPLEHAELYLAIHEEVAEGYLDSIYQSLEPPCADAYACFDAPVKVLRLGELLTLVTVPGEITPELVVGGITRPEDSTGPYPDAPAEPVLADHLATSHLFLIGLAEAEMGYIYPKMTYDPDTTYSYRHGPGPSLASHLMPALAELLDSLYD